MVSPRRMVRPHACRGMRADVRAQAWRCGRSAGRSVYDALRSTSVRSASLPAAMRPLCSDSEAARGRAAEQCRNAFERQAAAKMTALEQDRKWIARPRCRPMRAEIARSSFPAARASDRTPRCRLSRRAAAPRVLPDRAARATAARTSRRPQPLDILFGEEQIMGAGLDRDIHAARARLGRRDDAPAGTDVDDVQPRRLRRPSAWRAEWLPARRGPAARRGNREPRCAQFAAPVRR